MNRLSIILAIGMAAAVSAQTQCAPLAAAVPSCGKPCITSAASVAGCVSTDYACQCSSSAASVISGLAATCVLSNCGISMGLQVETSALAVCSCVSSLPPSSTTSTAPHTTSDSSTTKSAHPTSPSSASPASTASSSSATITSTPETSGTATSGAGSSPITSSSIFQSSPAPGGPIANTTAPSLPTFTGGQDMLRPVMSLGIVLFTLFGGLIVLL